MNDDRSESTIPEIGEGKRGEAGHLGYLLRQAAGVRRLVVERALEDLDVTQPQFLVMTLINAYPGSSGADLARAAMLTPQTMSVIVANLERENRLTRRFDVGNGRRQHLALTESGMATLLTCRARVQDLELDLTAGLSQEDEQIIRRWLVSVAGRGANG